MKIVIIGAGPGGYAAALRTAALGAETILIERGEVGGTCLNWGCIPTKTLVASADAVRKARRLAEFGIDLPCEPSANAARIYERKDKVVSLQIKGILASLKSRGILLIRGAGYIEGPNSVRVTKENGGTETVQADRIIISAGSRPADLPLFPFDGERILSSSDVLRLTSFPKSMIIVGAGVIGCEFACIFSAFGTEVAMVEMLPRAVATEDPAISAILERELKKKKVKLITGVKVTQVAKEQERIRVTLGNGADITAEKVLVSIGRALNTGGLGLESAGIACGPRGEITVNERMETNVKGIFAVGDITGKMLLAHVASHQGNVAAENACGHHAVMDYTVVPSGIFTSPEIGSVGLREHQAQESGVAVITRQFPFRALGKAHAMGEIEGMVKIVAGKDDGRVLGMHIIGPHASDLVHEGALAIKAGLGISDLAQLIHAHPTLAEGIMEAAGSAEGVQ